MQKLTFAGQLALFVVTGVALPGTLLAQPSGSVAAAGPGHVTGAAIATVESSPEQENSPPNSRAVLKGQVKLLSHCIDQAMGDLENQRLAELGQSWKAMVLAYDGTSRSVAACLGELGAARAQVELGLSVLEQLEQSEVEQRLDGKRLDRISEGLIVCREDLVKRLAELNRQFEQCEDDAQRTVLRRQMAPLVDRIGNLDRLTVAQEEGRTPWVAPERLERPFRDMQTQLAEDEQVLRVQARTVAELVEQVDRSGNRALVFLVEESQLPRNLVVDLQSSRRQLQTVLDELAGARTSIHRAVDDGVNRRSSIPDAPDDLIDRAQKLATQSSPTAPPKTIPLDTAAED